MNVLKGVLNYVFPIGGGEKSLGTSYTIARRGYSAHAWLENQ